MTRTFVDLLLGRKRYIVNATPEECAAVLRGAVLESSAWWRLSQYQPGILIGRVEEGWFWFMRNSRQNTKRKMRLSGRFWEDDGRTNLNIQVTPPLVPALAGVAFCTGLFFPGNPEAGGFVAIIGVPLMLLWLGGVLYEGQWLLNQMDSIVHRMNSEMDAEVISRGACIVRWRDGPGR